MPNGYNCTLNNYKWSGVSQCFELCLVFDSSEEKQFYISLYIDDAVVAAITYDFDDLVTASKAFNEIVTAAKAN